MCVLILDFVLESLSFITGLSKLEFVTLNSLFKYGYFGMLTFIITLIGWKMRVLQFMKMKESDSNVC